MFCPKILIYILKQIQPKALICLTVSFYFDISIANANRNILEKSLLFRSYILPHALYDSISISVTHIKIIRHILNRLNHFVCLPVFQICPVNFDPVINVNRHNPDLYKPLNNRLIFTNILKKYHFTAFSVINAKRSSAL